MTTNVYRFDFKNLVCAGHSFQILCSERVQDLKELNLWSPYVCDTTLLYFKYCNVKSVFLICSVSQTLGVLLEWHHQRIKRLALKLSLEFAHTSRTHVTHARRTRTSHTHAHAPTSDFFFKVPNGNLSFESMAATCLTTVTLAQQWMRDRLQLKHSFLGKIIWCYYKR